MFDLLKPLGPADFFIPRLTLKGGMQNQTGPEGDEGDGRVPMLVKANIYI